MKLVDARSIAASVHSDPVRVWVSSTAHSPLQFARELGAMRSPLSCRLGKIVQAYAKTIEHKDAEYVQLDRTGTVVPMNGVTRVLIALDDDTKRMTVFHKELKKWATSKTIAALIKGEFGKDDAAAYEESLALVAQDYYFSLGGESFKDGTMSFIYPNVVVDFDAIDSSPFRVKAPDWVAAK